MLTLLAAASLSIAVPSSYDLGSVYSKLYYFDEFYGKDAAAVVQLWTDPKGRVLDCKIKASIGTARLAVRLCELLEGTRISRPVATGEPAAYGLTVLTLAISDPRIVYNKVPFKELIRQLHEVSRGEDDTVSGAAVEEPVTGQLKLHVDRTGRVVDCERPDKPDTSLDCPTVQNRTFEIRSDAAGNPVPYVRNYMVLFTPQ